MTFYNFFQSKKLGGDVNLTIIEIAVVVPMIGFIWMLYNRRNTCLDLLSEAKTTMLYILRAHMTWKDDDDEEIQQTMMQFNQLSKAMHAVLSGMHNYFLPSRFYSTRYPYVGYKSAMVRCVLVGWFE